MIEGAVLASLAVGRPRWARARAWSARAAAATRAPRSPPGRLSLTLAVTGLPVAIASHQRAVDYGLSTQDLGSWLEDVAKSALIGAVLAARSAA